VPLFFFACCLPCQVVSVVLGSGDETHRTARKILHSLRMCERHDTVELTNLDYVGLPRQRGSPGNQKLVAALAPWHGLWLLLPFRVTKEKRSGPHGSQDWGDQVELACLPQSPWSGTLRCELHKAPDTGEVSFRVAMGTQSSAGFHAVRDVVVNAITQGMCDIVKQELTVSGQRDKEQAAYQESSIQALRNREKRRRDAVLEKSDSRALGRFRGGFARSSYCLPSPLASTSSGLGKSH